MDPIRRFLFALQEISILIWKVFAALFSKPRYVSHAMLQMDLIGVGSLPIILLTGFFTGGVLVLQSVPVLSSYGTQNLTGQLVATSLIRELCPVLSALMISGRIGSAISAELGSMVVSQQIEAMRALGTNPIRKLVAPRIVALVIMLPLLTVAADIMGLIGGGIVSKVLYDHDIHAFIQSLRHGISTTDLIGGIIKPLFFGLIIGSVSCYKGLNVTGGTVGVGRSTTDAVVISSVWVIVFDFFLSRALQYLLDI